MFRRVTKVSNEETTSSIRSILRDLEMPGTYCFMSAYASFVIFLLLSLLECGSIFFQINLRNTEYFIPLCPLGNSTDLNEHNLKLLDFFLGEQRTEETRL